MEHFGMFHPGVEQRFALADVAVDHPGLTLEKRGARQWTKIDHRDIPRSDPVHAARISARSELARTKEAKENDARFAQTMSAFGVGVIGGCSRDRANSRRSSHGIKWRARPSDFDMPKWRRPQAE